MTGQVRYLPRTKLELLRCQSYSVLQFKVQFSLTIEGAPGRPLYPLKMQEQDILRKVGEALTQKDKTIEIEIKPAGKLQKLLMKKGFLKSKKVFKISPILVGNRYRVSAVAVNLPKDIFQNGKVNLTKAWEAIQKHTDDFIYIVGVCVQNTEKEPSKRLLRSLRWMDDQQFLKILDASLSQAGVTSFMNSIVLISGASVLNVEEPAANPAQEQE